MQRVLNALNGILNGIVCGLSELHGLTMQFNDRFFAYATDWEVHAVAIGAVGLVLFLLILPLFRRMARRGQEAVISFLFVLLLMIALLFGIEIGSMQTGTPGMDFGELFSGIGGFLLIMAVYAVLRLIIAGARRITARLRGRRRYR